MQGFVIYAFLIVGNPKVGLLALLNQCPESVMDLRKKKRIIHAFLTEKAIANPEKIQAAINRLTLVNDSSIQEAAEQLRDCHKLLQEKKWKKPTDN